MLGTIVVERLMDLAAILACLGWGLRELRHLDPAGAVDFGRLFDVALGLAALLGAGVLLGRRLSAARLPPAIVARLRALALGLRALNRASLARRPALTALVWAAEVAALWTMLYAVGAPLHAAQAMFVMGVASLSTLVPTAPGYLGTYQLVFASALPALGGSASLGVLGSALIQLCLFGSVTLAGLLLYAGRALHNVPPYRKEAPQRGTEPRPS